MPDHRVTLLSRYPRVDTPAWKRDLGARLLDDGLALSVAYSRAALADQFEAGVREFGPVGLIQRYAQLRRGSAAPSANGGSGEDPRTLAAWARGHSLPVVEGRRLSDGTLQDAIRDLRPDVIALVGADIVPAAVLAIPRVATLNAHYGLLPAYRGMNVTEWSLYRGDPIGVTVHVVEAGIDTGDILLREEIPVESGDTLESLRAKHQRVAAMLLRRAIVGMLDGSLERVEQGPEDGRQYFRMHPELRRTVEARLAER